MARLKKVVRRGPKRTVKKVVRRRAGKKVVKKVVTKQSSAARARRQRRAAFAAQPPAVRAAAAALLPKSRRQVGKKIGLKRRTVLRLMQAVAGAPNAAVKAATKTELDKEVKLLAGLVSVAHKKRKRALRGGVSGIEPISPEQAKARLARVKVNLAETKQALKEIDEKKTGPKKKRNQRQLLRAKKAHLIRRASLLKNGLDFVRPVKVHPSRVAVQRRPLGLPRAWAVPSQADTTVMIRLIGSQIKRMPHESDTLFTQRLNAYTQRALVRFVNISSAGVESAPAARQAVEATLVEDAPAIDAESEAGGVVPDPVAETMESVIQPVADQLDAVAEDMQVEVPAGSPSEEEIGQVLQAAEEAEVDAAQAPAEPADEIAEDLLSAEEPFLPDLEDLDFEDVEVEVEEGEEEPLYKDPMVVMGVIGGLGLLWFLSGR
jgi:hypothetical protein